MGLPGETVEDYYETVKVARLAKPYHCYVSIFFPYLGTDLANTAIELTLIDKEHLSPKSERSTAQLDLPGFSKRRIRFEYIIFFWRVYRGIWPMSKVVAQVFAAYLKAHPKMYSFYLYARDNFSFIMKLSNKYSSAQHDFKDVRKIAHSVKTREDYAQH